MSYKTSLIRNVTLVSVMSLCTTATAFAQTASTATTLGSLWQNAQDVSTSPNWHIYAIVLNGIKYIQIKDQAGVVHAMIGVINGTSFVTPMGVDAMNVSTPSSSAASSTATDAGATQTIYNDGTTTVTATPQTDGTMKFATIDICTTPVTCGGNGGP